jgi:hypothetical protein
MEQRRTLAQMRSHLARAEREVQSARQFLDVPGGGSCELALARALANASMSIHDAMDTLQQILHEQRDS